MVTSIIFTMRTGLRIHIMVMFNLFDVLIKCGVHCPNPTKKKENQFKIVFIRNIEIKPYPTHESSRDFYFLGYGLKKKKTKIKDEKLTN